MILLSFPFLPLFVDSVLLSEEKFYPVFGDFLQLPQRFRPTRVRQKVAELFGHLVRLDHTGALVSSFKIVLVAGIGITLIQRLCNTSKHSLCATKGWWCSKDISTRSC